MQPSNPDWTFRVRKFATAENFVTSRFDRYRQEHPGEITIENYHQYADLEKQLTFTRTFEDWLNDNHVLPPSIFPVMERLVGRVMGVKMDSEVCMGAYDLEFHSELDAVKFKMVWL